MMGVMKAAATVWPLALLIALMHCSDVAAADERINEAGGTNRNPNEPEGFVPIIAWYWAWVISVCDIWNALRLTV